ncbi:LacI family DNA-binding transcriptional regulator [Sinorhizobium meliloti]|uniref:LacI family DNA-binding transcriptional regulator n=1 Tax=Rhizobium meliloti TaxID=382 RepID=UPI00398CE2B2
MANEKVTSNDVARLAGVSQSAVSRYFTPGTSVSKKTAEKIRAAAEELGYRPNVLARSLITGRSHHRPRRRLSGKLLLSGGSRASVEGVAGPGLSCAGLHLLDRI